MRIRFTDLRPGKDKSWVAEIPVDGDGMLDGEMMGREARRGMGLMSRGVDCEEDGGVYVGGFRKLGKWEVENAESV